MVECPLCLGLVRGFAARKVAAKVVGVWVVLEEPHALGGGHHQPKVVELAPSVGKNVCSGHRTRK